MTFKRKNLRDAICSEVQRIWNVGLTVLKRKCKEFRIPRWPHRKIKSFNALIRDLSLHFAMNNKNNGGGGLIPSIFIWSKLPMLWTNFASKLEVEQSFLIELSFSTKRFRQDLERGHKPRALKNQYLTVFHDQMTELDD
ncbi:RWP-RK domain-containing 5 [Hibiscus trionum]|uniref:RWP-RK domain-containing 5 n=1 Tax=Hibiscus trionum TaxID=183268 RepID=A0A9W7GV24_HIBTR|nr:RWP-RK domain-containing 5 [Hibiscus trionum]